MGNKGSEIHYNIEVLNGRTKLTIGMIACTGDADLYVSCGMPPTKNN